jgi:hypothetical protein
LLITLLSQVVAAEDGRAAAVEQVDFVQRLQQQVVVAH